AELVDRAIEEGLFLVRQRGRRIGQKLGPVGIAGEKVRIPPDVARLERFALGVGHRRQDAAGGREDRLGDEVAAKAHGKSSWFGADGGNCSGKWRVRVN